jgi:tetratricopeptide (TPR) repeat protein
MTAMRYLCVHCDEKFELEAQHELRCPKCMRVHGIRQLADSAAVVARSPRNRVRLGAIATLLVLAAAGAYMLWRRELGPDPATLASSPLAARVLQRELERASVQAGPLVRLLEPDAQVERFALRASAGQSDAHGKAVAVVNALRARASRAAFVPWSLSDPRIGSLRTAAQVLAAISKDGAQQQLYPLELAALAVAALRAVSVPAMLAEVYAWPGEHVPLDPSGRFGYFAPALLQPHAAARVLDAYGGRPEQPSCAQCAVLSDLQAVGAGLALMASQRLAANEDPAIALRDADAAVKLLPSSPSVRSARGAVLLANGASDLGQGELEAASQMRPDAARRNNLAMLYLATGDGERAAREVAQVLEQQPDFALGHATLAEIHLSRGEREQARTELEKAEALDPKLTSLALTWAQFHAAVGENEQAIAQGRRALEARPNDPQTHLVLARIYRQAARYEDMRAEARAVLALVPQALSSRTRALIERFLGPTALEGGGEPSAASGASPNQAGPSALPEPGRLDLSQAPAADHARMRLLDSSDSSPSAPSDGTLKHAGEPTKLRLSESGKQLHLGTH